MTIGIVGAGIAGLSCAASLAEAGISVTLLDKGRVPGGRLSTLSIEEGEWDYGAQYIDAATGRFSDQLARWMAGGTVARWDAGPVGGVVPAPQMRSLVETLCAGRDVRFSHRVDRAYRQEGGWMLAGPDFESGPFAAVILATPAEQAAPLLSLHDLVMAREAAAVRSAPCWSVMASFPEPLTGVPSVIADCGELEWAARNNSKPGRSAGECWVLQASAEWSRQNLDAAREDVANALLGMFATEVGTTLPAPTFLKAHRWRFARPHGTTGRVLWNADLQLGACGDWCVDPTIAGAWEAGTMLGEVVAADLLAVQPVVRLA